MRVGLAAVVGLVITVLYPSVCLADAESDLSGIVFWGEREGVRARQVLEGRWCDGAEPCHAMLGNVHVNIINASMSVARGDGASFEEIANVCRIMLFALAGDLPADEARQKMESAVSEASRMGAYEELGPLLEWRVSLARGDEMWCRFRKVGR